VPKRLDGRSILVTGVASGLGRATAILCGREGACIVCADLNREGAEEAAESIVAEGGQAFGIAVEVSNLESTEGAVKAAVFHYGRLDAAIHSAGIAGPGRAGDIDEAHWHKVLSVNLTGAWLLSRVVLPVMQAQNNGSIVLIASIAGLLGIPGLAAYSASKGVSLRSPVRWRSTMHRTAFASTRSARQQYQPPL
jgi:NAD(P)-dependent dehydrogenase (short-subunit alcohol dehydrogenase family)